MEKDDGQWVRATKDYANTRYSSLTQVNTGNVANLKVAWTFNTGVARGPETIRRRIARRMVLLRIDHISQYLRFLQVRTDELQRLQEDVLIKCDAVLPRSRIPGLTSNQRSADPNARIE